MYTESDPTSHWEYFAINILVTTFLATAAELHLMGRLQVIDT